MTIMSRHFGEFDPIEDAEAFEEIDRDVEDDDDDIARASRDESEEFELESRVDLYGEPISVDLIIEDIEDFDQERMDHIDRVLDRTEQMNEAALRQLRAALRDGDEAVEGFLEQAIDALDDDDQGETEDALEDVFGVTDPEAIDGDALAGAFDLLTISVYANDDEGTFVFSYYIDDERVPNVLEISFDVDGEIASDFELIELSADEFAEDYDDED